MSREFSIRPDGDRLHIRVRVKRGGRPGRYKPVGWIRASDLRSLADTLHDYADANEDIA